MKDELKIIKPMYDHSIEFDTSSLPKYIIDAIAELERLEKEGDWLNYDIQFDILEIKARGYLRHKKIKEKDYKKIVAKYGGLYD